jgi:hypothetical protein
MVHYLFPSVGKEARLQRTCPHCARSGGRIHSAVWQRLTSDIRVSTIAQWRIHCAYCGTSWTIRAEGIKERMSAFRSPASGGGVPV